MKIDFAGQKAVLTGAAQGIGREICLQLARGGAQLRLCDFNAPELAETARLCREAGALVEYEVFDIRDKSAIDAFAAKAEQGGSGKAGPADVFIHVAGGVCGQVGRPLEEITESDWRDIYAVNCDAMFWFCRALAPGMKRAGRGRIVVISSMAGLGVSLTGIQAYASAKAAEIGLARQLAHELGPFGITVNCVAPGFILSNPATVRQWEAYGPQGQAELVRGIALRRTGSPEDVAHAVLFLASDYAGWITGQTLSVDGGK